MPEEHKSYLQGLWDAECNGSPVKGARSDVPAGMAPGLVSVSKEKGTLEVTNKGLRALFTAKGIHCA
jgi:hypothetical protein